MNDDDDEDDDDDATKSLVPACIKWNTFAAHCSRTAACKEAGKGLLADCRAHPLAKRSRAESVGATLELSPRCVHVLACAIGLACSTQSLCPTQLKKKMLDKRDLVPV